MSNITYSKNVSLDTFSQIKIDIEPDKGIVWKYLKPYPRPCFNSQLIAEVEHLQARFYRPQFLRNREYFQSGPAVFWKMTG